MEDFRSSNEDLLRVEVEKKIQDRDYAGARVLIENANTKHLPEMLAMCDVLCAANMEFPGYGIDWYWVLQVFPTADMDAIEAQYKKLSSQLRIIDERLQSRDSALKLIQTAHSVLSAPTHRASFDRRRDHIWEQLCNQKSEQKCELDIENEAVIPGTETSADVNLDDPTSISRPGSSADKAVPGGTVLKLSEYERHRHATKSLSPKANCSGECGPSQHNPSSVNVASVMSTEQRLNLKAKWSIQDFVPNQVWAVYDIGPFPLPRFYAKVVDVVPPSNVRVVFLEPNPRLEEEIRWMEEGLPVACGVFRVGREVVDVDIARFSHAANCELSTGKSFCRIFPRKGEIWALHKNWHSNWKPADYCRRWCQIVEIVSDFSNDDCVKACSLVEIDGFVTFFKRQLYEGSTLVKKFFWSEMLSFSHQIPAYTVVGVEDRRIPKESWHLEPDALPFRLDCSCNVA